MQDVHSSLFALDISILGAGADGSVGGYIYNSYVAIM